MNASEFNKLIRNFPEMEASYIRDIEEEITKAPYCQSLHILLARLKQDQSDPSTQQFIQKAAVYSSNRGHLKHILEQKISTIKFSDPVPQLSQPVVGIETTSEVASQDQKISVGSGSIVPAQKSEIDTKEFVHDSSFDSIADELMVDLEILKDKTETFSKLSGSTESTKESTKGSTQAETKSKIKETKISSGIGLTSKTTKGLDETDLLLNEIKSSRKKIKSDNNRQSEQLEIIDQFIKAKQVTIKPPEKSIQRQDLTENSGAYSENVISETLVEILVRQGKRDKAIDVLKKLIWKFPQKKALFATRIQELSK